MMWLPSVGADRQRMRRVWIAPVLRNVRVFMYGPRWQRHFDVQRRPVADIDPEAARYHRAGKRLLIYDVEADVRERVLEELRPGVVAQWVDPRERLARRKEYFTKVK
jgi:hypothetical protein